MTTMARRFRTVSVQWTPHCSAIDRGYPRDDGDPMDLLAIGDDVIISKIEEFLAAGCSKLVLTPLQTEPTMMAQTSN